MKKLLAMLMAVAMCFTLLTACGNSSDTPPRRAAPPPRPATTPARRPPTAPPSSWGGTGPLTGGASIYGLAAQRGAQIAVDEIREAAATSSSTCAMRTMSTWPRPR